MKRSPSSFSLYILFAIAIWLMASWNTRLEAQPYLRISSITDFQLKSYGNFPNPFSRETFIAFEIQESIADEVEIKLYASSGRLVRTFRFPPTNPDEGTPFERGNTGDPRTVGYHEAWWDGRDASGNDLANGVYFFRIRAFQGDVTLQETGTMARKR